MSTKPTPKQRAFALAIVAGKNPAEAYRAAGYSVSNMSKSTISREAQKLLRNPKITTIIERGTKEAISKAVWSREIAIERLVSVNTISYTSIVGEGHTGRDDNAAFFNSLDRLNNLADISDTAEVNVPVFIFDRGSLNG